MSFLKPKPLNMKSGLLLFSLFPMFVLICIISIFISNSQLQKTLPQAENKFAKAVQEINVSIDQAIDFSINTISNQYIISIFEKEYENSDMNYQAFLSVDMFFTNYKEKTSATQKSIIVYHNNYTMYRSTFSKYMDSLEPSLLRRLENLKTTDTLWTEDAENFYLYKALASNDFIFITEYNVPKSKIDSIINKFDVLKNENQSLENNVILSDAPQSGSYVINKTLANGQNIYLCIPELLKYNICLKNFILYFVCFSLFALVINILSNLFTNRFKHKVTVFIDTIAGNDGLVEIGHIPLEMNDILNPVYNKIIQLIVKVNELHKKTIKL